MTRAFHRVGVVGLGLMGAGIAEVLARGGYDVVGVEVDEESLERGRDHLARSTGRAVRRGRLTETEAADLLARIRFTTGFEDLADCELVVEAVVERLAVKREIVRRLDEIVAPDAVLATNTSSLSVTEIAAAGGRPGRVVGLHFFNPAPVQDLVEIIRTVVTDPEVVDDLAELARSLGKTPVVVGDRAGFIANALLFGYLNHAASMYESRQATREDLDAAMRHGCGYPMGPLALLDLIGLDTACEILATMYRQSRDRLHAPAPILSQLRSAGLLGRKSGRGFYSYEAPGSPVVVADDLTPRAQDSPRLRRPVDTVGVVGAGPLATRLVEGLTRAGFTVRTATVESTLEDLSEVDLAVEAVEADAEATAVLFGRLDAVCRPGAILATTSPRPVVGLARVTARPHEVVGLHVVDRALGSGLIEVVSTVRTGADVAETARAVVERLGEVAVSCGDRAGFVVDALLFPYLNDAVTMLEAGYASVDDIDAAMTLGCALPAGPFEVLDRVGTDASLAVLRALFRERREPGLVPAPLLEQLVAAGFLGRETGRGFRDHPVG